MYRKKVLTVLTLAILITGGCAALQKFAQTPSVTFEGVSFRDMSLFEATPVFKLKVTNPNPVGISVGRITYDLKLNNEPFIKDALDKGIIIASGGSEIVEVPVTLNYLDFFETVTAFNKSNEVAYDLSGAVSLGILDIPYHTSGSFPVPKLPDISLKSVDIDNLSLTGASLVFSLELENKNPFTVKLNGLDYGIKLGGKEVAKGETEITTPLDKEGKSSLKIPMDISFLRLGRAVYNLMSKSSTGYDLSGTMTFDVPKIGEKKFPFQKLGEVPFHK